MNRPKLFFEARMSADDAKVGNVYISGPITSGRLFWGFCVCL